MAEECSSTSLPKPPTSCPRRVWHREKPQGTGGPGSSGPRPGAWRISGMSAFYLRSVPRSPWGWRWRDPCPLFLGADTSTLGARLDGRGSLPGWIGNRKANWASLSSVDLPASFQRVAPRASDPRPSHLLSGPMLRCGFVPPHQPVRPSRQQPLGFHLISNNGADRVSQPVGVD